MSFSFQYVKCSFHCNLARRQINVLCSICERSLASRPMRKWCKGFFFALLKVYAVFNNRRIGREGADLDAAGVALSAVV